MKEKFYRTDLPALEDVSDFRSGSERVKHIRYSHPAPPLHLPLRLAEHAIPLVPDDLSNRRATLAREPPDERASRTREGSVARVGYRGG